jgi:bilirubin oxidase
LILTRGILLAAALLVVSAGTAGHHMSATESGNWLAAPRAMTNVSKVPGTVEVSLVAEAARMSLRPGGPTEVFAYNGTIPGPTLELHEGDRVIVHFENRLSTATTVHWHGLHIPFDADGSPFHPVEPGEKRVYSFTLRPGSAGTYWYHPHPNHATGIQVAKGLYGAIIVRAPDDPLPRSLEEQLIVLADNRFLPDGSIDLPEKGSHQAAIDEENGREGDVLFVNGQIMPTLSVASGEVQRWRVINASASRVYRLAIPGQTMLHVGSDGGLFEKPVRVSEVTVANGERVELLVSGAGRPGERTVLQALPYDRYIHQTRPTDWKTTKDLLTLQYTAPRAGRGGAIPPTLRPVPALDTADASITRVVTLSQGLINGKAMDMDRIDFSAKLGATEIWEIENIVGMDHPFHLHGFQFQVIDRNGVPEPFRSWKDLVNVPKHQTARIIVNFANYPGKWMFHCHILDHEDHGMMGILEVKQ